MWETLPVKKLPLPPAWTHALDAWALALRAAGRTAQTIETRTEHLRRFARQTGAPSPALIPRSRVIEWAGSHNWARETRRSTYSSLRAFYRWAVEVSLVAEDPSGDLPAVRPSIPCPRPAPEAAYRAALGRADERGRVILRLAAEAGLRRAEIAQVQASDLARDLVGWSLLVHGKGERVRLVPLSDSLAGEMCRYLGHRRYLLPSPGGGHLTARHVGKIGAALLESHWTLHTLRHRFATRTHQGTGDLLAVQTLLGHASVATTQRYVATSSEVLRLAVNAAAV